MIFAREIYWALKATNRRDRGFVARDKIELYKTRRGARFAKSSIISNKDLSDYKITVCKVRVEVIEVA